MSRKVERKKDFEKITLVWRDLTIFITAFCDILPLTMDVYEAISTHRDGGWGQDDVTPQGVCRGNQVQVYILEYHEQSTLRQSSPQSNLTDFSPSL